MGGGAFLLTLSVIAGVLLITVPAKTTENIDTNVHAAATEIVDGDNYTVINIYNNTNTGTMYGLGNTENVKIVLQENYNHSTHYEWWGESSAFNYNKIIDLNGFTLSIKQLDVNVKNLEIRDSSAKQTGKLICTDLLRVQQGGGGTVSIYGGTIEASGIAYGRTARIYGGYLKCSYVSGNTAFYIAPHMQATYDTQGRVLTCQPIERKSSDGETYQTVVLKGNSDLAQSKAAFFGGNSTVNYYYIVLNDWDFVTNKISGTVYGNKIVLDLNGHHLVTTDSSGGGWYPVFQCTTLEYTDTSLTGGSIGTTVIGGVKSVVCSGNGSYVIGSGSSSAIDITIRGGKSVTFSFWGSGGLANANLTVAPYMLALNDSNSWRVYRPTHNSYIISTSTIVSGAYNYEFGQVWDLTVGQLANLAVPDDKTYYLWGRNADGAYEYLNIYYDRAKQAWAKVIIENEN